MNAPQPAGLILEVAGILDGLGIRWCIGGSIAANFFGVARATRDVDLVVELVPEHLGPLADALEKRFYVSRSAMDEAFRDRGSFNAVDAGSGFKIDFFVMGNDPFDRQEIERRQMLPLPGSPGTLVPAKSLEDTVLRKLFWFRAGGEASDVQWRDVLTLLRANADVIDQRYLEDWATGLDLRELLARARTDSAR